MGETVVQIEKNIYELSSLQKFDEFLKLADFYHIERRENVDCSDCLFIISLRYLHIQNTVAEKDSIDLLQKVCRMKYVKFHSIRLFLRSLGTIEKKD